MDTTGVYVITCLPTGKQYVGSSGRSIAGRWYIHRYHLQKGVHHSAYLQRAWDKHGAEAFTFAILEECPPEDCMTCEQYWIDTLNPVFNMQPRAYSMRGYHLSPAAREKIAQAQAGHLDGPASPARRAAIAAALRGKPKSAAHIAMMRLRRHSEVTRARISQIRKGMRLSPEHRAAIAEGLKGRPVSPETRALLSQRLTGIKRTPEQRERNRQAQLGKVLSPETRAKISASLTGNPALKRPRILTPEGRAALEEHGRWLAAHRRKHEYTAEVREHMRAAQLGKKASPETRAKQSAMRKGKKLGPFSDEHRANLAKAARGRVISPETREKMRQAHLKRHAPTPPHADQSDGPSSNS